MARVDADLLERTERFCYRMLDVVDVLAEQERSRRLLDQISACGTSVGANLFEADEAVSSADFCKCLGIVLKELNESRFWLRLVAQREWIPAARLEPLLGEVTELKKIFVAMSARTRRRQQHHSRMRHDDGKHARAGPA